MTLKMLKPSWEPGSAAIFFFATFTINNATTLPANPNLYP